MRILTSFILALWLAIVSAFADSSFVAPTANGTAAVGQLPGTTTNDNASAGNVGEVISSIGQNTGGTVTITNASPGVISDAGTCITNQLTGCIGIGNVLNLTTTGALPTGLSTGTNYYVLATGFTPGTSYQISTSPFGTAVNTSSAGSGTQTRGNATVGCGNNANCTVAAVSLTAGDWRCIGTTDSTATGVTTAFQTFIGTTNNSATGKIAQSTIYDTVGLTAPELVRSTAPTRILLSGTTIYYLLAQGTFSTGSFGSAGSMICTRTR